MRTILLTLAAFALAACDSGTVPSPAEQAELRASNPVVESNEVALNADGLIAGPEAFYFAAGQNEVEGALARTFGQAGDSSDMPDCGVGPMVSSRFPGGLIVNYKDGSLVGWLWEEESTNIGVTGDLRIGAARDSIEAEPGFAMIEGSTLGEEFAIGDRIGGFFEDGAVSALYAGTQCFFR
ncbi:aspartate-semialdehyde dehydrogenase [Erythrobacter ani]|uniref:Aspartate-semialdehyde dehydrogenase n=1 Tax=Erythrobacter ani TaxID=2827235 RepID=A0ABS6SP86_9SPHN|nr:aspartate-semialdehyde dehydrogenase [Erythrobacter ani]MBV7266845.1 aspartate-semialdehyde dehydrogenase [Erythrobacter ani]